jgi:hypothetical protein
MHLVPHSYCAFTLARSQTYTYSIKMLQDSAAMPAASPQPMTTSASPPPDTNVSASSNAGALTAAGANAKAGGAAPATTAIDATLMKNMSAVVL